MFFFFGNRSTKTIEMTSKNVKN